jgi:hypothetical protein
MIDAGPEGFTGGMNIEVYLLYKSSKSNINQRFVDLVKLRCFYIERWRANQTLSAES